MRGSITPLACQAVSHAGHVPKLASSSNQFERPRIAGGRSARTRSSSNAEKVSEIESTIPYISQATPSSVPG